MKNEINRELLDIPREQWADMWGSTQHLIANVIDVIQWNTYAVYKSQAGRQHVPQPKPMKRPTYGKQPESPKTVQQKPRSLKDLGGFMGAKFNAAKPS